LTRHALALPQAFGDNLRLYVRSYLRRSREAGIEPDAMLLAPLKNLLGSDPPTDA
jgi:hypothetical protein